MAAQRLQEAAKDEPAVKDADGRRSSAEGALTRGRAREHARPRRRLGSRSGWAKEGPAPRAEDPGGAQAVRCQHSRGLPPVAARCTNPLTRRAWFTSVQRKASSSTLASGQMLGSWVRFIYWRRRSLKITRMSKYIEHWEGKKRGRLMYLFELGPIYFAYSCDSWGEKMWGIQQKGPHAQSRCLLTAKTRLRLRVVLVYVPCRHIKWFKEVIWTHSSGASLSLSIIQSLSLIHFWGFRKWSLTSYE